MKRLATIILIVLSCNSFAYIINVGDTTLTSNWSAGNNILNITGKITGAYTISNAIIQANPFTQIFDTTISLGANIQCAGFSCMWYGAKPSNQDNSTQLQMAINACKDRGYALYFHSGIYNTSQPLIVSTPTGGGYYTQTSIKIIGTATFWDNGTGSTINYSGDSCALGLQLNKGSYISGLIISGGWASPNGSDSTYFNTSSANYINQNAHGNGVGLWIDPVGNWSQRSGSTGCHFSDLYVKNFKTLIQISNSISQNGDIMIFDNIQLGNAKIGIQTSQPQEKGNVFRGIYSWGSLYTLFQINNGNYYIDGGNIAGLCINLFNVVSGGWFPTHIRNLFAENIGSVGSISTTMPMEITDCVFDFSQPSYTGNLKLINGNNNYIKFNSCTFRYYGYSNNLPFSGNATFDNCLFSGTITGGDGNIITNYYNNAIVTTSNRTLTVTTDTMTTNSVKISLRKSYLPQ